MTGRWHGAHPAVVTDVDDPAGEARVRVRLPWAPDPEGAPWEAWARLSAPMAGDGRGLLALPDVDDEVLVVFLAGDPAHPVVVGALWNGQDQPPRDVDARNDHKVWRTRSGHELAFDDSSGRGVVELRTGSGQRVRLGEGPGEVLIEDGLGNSVELAAGGITVTATAKVTITASAVEVSAGSVTVNAGMSRFSGVVQADTVITNSVVSAAYTPGAGNIW